MNSETASAASSSEQRNRRITPTLTLGVHFGFDEANGFFNLWVALSPRCVYRHGLLPQSTAMAFSIRRVAPSRRRVFRYVLCPQSTAMAFSIRRVAPSPRCVFRYVLCPQSTAMAFSIRRVAPSPCCVFRHILCHQSAQHAVDLCRDTVGQSQVLFRARRSTSTRFHSTCISPHASRPSR